MATKKKMLQAAAGQAGGAGLDITDVFSTYLYTGNGSTQTITNDIDLAGEGGLVWTKSRETGYSHELIDTERGIKKTLRSNGTDAEGTVSSSAGFSSFNSNGYSIAGQFGTWGSLNVNNEDHVSWTFRKAPKFFDVVTYTGTASVQNISHNLGSVPGMIIVKRLDSSSFNWQIYHRNSNATPEDYRLEFTTGAAQLNTGVWGGTAPTDTHFTVGVNGDSNGSGGSFVAYLFAHNNGDGGFGPSGDQDIIKCGSYTGNGTVGQEINLGFEPQFVMAKITNTTGNWYIQDAMRTMTGNGSPTLKPNSSDAEYNSNGFTEGNIELTSTGFKLDTNDQGGGNGSGDTYIYMAIRRGTKVPESADEVFDVYAGSDAYPTVITTGFTVDSLLGALRSGNSNNFISGSRLTGSKSLITSSTAAEGNGLFSGSTNACFMRNDGILPSTFGSSNTVYYSWKRAPGFFDVVAYTGDGTSSRAISHNLGVEPELIISKRRSGTRSWFTQAPGPLGYASLLYLDTSDAAATNGVQYGMSTADAETFTTGTSHSFVNSSGDTFITYLFASLDGISKVGSYTGNGESVVQTIDCGFTSSARFVLIKKSSSTGNWIVYDVERGITTATSDGVLLLNSTNAESPESLFFAGNAMQPDSSGFKVTTDDLNRSGDTYIFYAIA